MQNGDEASPSINLAGQALLVKMLITLEPHDIFSSNFASLYTLHCLDTSMQKQRRGFTELASVQPVMNHIVYFDQILLTYTF